MEFLIKYFQSELETCPLQSKKGMLRIGIEPMTLALLALRSTD